MTRGERPLLRDSPIVFVAGLFALSSVPLGVLVGVLNVDRPRDLVVDLDTSSWTALPVGIALVACSVVVAYALLARAWVSEMTGIVMVALAGMVAAISLGLVVVALAIGLAVHRVRSPKN